MNWNEACENLKQGNKIRQPHWGEGEYVHFVRDVLCDEHNEKIFINIDFLECEEWEVIAEDKRCLTLIEYIVRNEQGHYHVMTRLLRRDEELEEPGWTIVAPTGREFLIEAEDVSN